MSEQPEFWDAAKDWSVRKHLILRYYLKPAIAKLGRASRDRRVVLLDAFAGRGAYEDGTPGSPVLTGHLTEEVRAWSNPVDLRVINVEPDAASFAELEERTARWRAGGAIQNFHGTFRQHLSHAPRETGDSPLFAFLDPFRPTDLLFGDFAALLTRRAITELVLVFHTPAVIRMLGAVRADARTQGAARQTIQERLTAIYGSDRWKSLPVDPRSDPEAVVGCLRDQFFHRWTGARRFVASHPIWQRYGVGLKYHIVFCTRSPHGVRLINDAFCKEEQAVYQMSGISDQPSLFPEEAPRLVEITGAERLRILQDILIQIGGAAPDRRWKRTALVFETLLRHFGDFTQRERLQALRELIERSAGPRFVPLNGRQTKAGRWITNDQTLLAFEA